MVSEATTLPTEPPPLKSFLGRNVSSLVPNYRTFLVLKYEPNCLLSFIFTLFSIQWQIWYKIRIYRSIDGVLGIWTQDCRMVSAGQSLSYCDPPTFIVTIWKLLDHNILRSSLRRFFPATSLFTKSLLERMNILTFLGDLSIKSPFSEIVSL